MANELATAYITLLPSARKIGDAISKDLAGTAKTAGRASGLEFAKAFEATKVQPQFVSTAAVPVSRASEAAARTAVASTVAANVAVQASAAGAKDGAEYGRKFSAAAQRELDAANLNLNKARASQRSLGLSNVDKTAPVLAAQARVDAAQMSADAEDAAAQAAALAGASFSTKFSGALSSNASTFTSTGVALTKGVTLPLAAIGAGSVTTAISFESAFAGVRKTVDATETEFAGLRQGIRDIANETPATREEVAGIAEAAGQLGIENGNILGFTKVMIDLGNSTNLTGEQAATTFARFANITGLPQTQFENLGSAVVALGNNFATTESEITELAARLAGAGTFIGLSEADILGFSAALSSVGIEAEAGGTAFSRVFKEVDAAARNGGEALDIFAGLAGTSAEEFKAAYEGDASEALGMVVEGLGRVVASGGDAVGILDQLGLSDVRVSDSLLRAANAGDLFTRALETANTAFEENTALSKEAEQRYATTESKLKILANRFSDVGVDLGTALLPTIVAVADATLPLVQAVGFVAEGFAKLPGPIRTGVAGILALSAAAGPTAVAVGKIGENLSAMKTKLAAAQAAGGGLSNITAQFTGIQKGIAAATVAAIGFGIAISRNSSQKGEGVEAFRLKEADLVPALDPTKTEAQSVALQTLARSMAEVNEVGVFSASDWALDQVGAFDDAGNRASVAEADIESFKQMLATMPVATDTAKEAVASLADRLESYGFTSEEAAEAVKPFYDAIDDRGIVDEATSNITAATTAAQGAGGAFALGATGTATFADSLAQAELQAQAASVGIDAAAAAADRYRSSIEAASSADDLLGAGLASGAAMRSLRVGLGLEVGESERQNAARKAAVEADRLATEARKATSSVDAMADALARLDPRAASAKIELDSLASAASAFTASIQASSSIDDELGASLSVGDGFRELTRNMRRLPKDINMATASVGKYTPRQREAIQAMLDLGTATTSYLATLVETGRSTEYVRSEADRLRNEFVAQARAAGKSEEQIAQLLESMGLLPAQIETAIKVSGAEEARFKFEAIAQLLNGRIPSEVAASVIAAIDVGDVEGAARQLADFAATNPVKLALDPSFTDQVTTAQDALEEANRTTLELPQNFDFATAAVGGYTEAQERGLQAILSSADASKEYLATLVGSGQYDTARTESARLRDSYLGVLAAMGVTGEAAERYVELLGLTPAKVETAIVLSGADEAMFKLNFLRDAMVDKDGKSTIPERIETFITTKVAEGDLTTAANVMSALQIDLQDGAMDNPILLALNADPTQATATAEAWRREIINGETPYLPVGAATGLAFEGVEEWRSQVMGGMTPYLPVGADVTAATATKEAWQFGVTSGAPTDVPLGLNTTFGNAQFAAWKAHLQAQGVKIPVELEVSVSNAREIIDQGGYGAPYSIGVLELARGFDMNNNGIIGRNTGGLIPGNGVVDSVPVMATPHEFMTKASIVRREGVPAFEALNAGRATIMPLETKSKQKSVQFLNSGGLVGPGLRAVPALAPAAEPAAVGSGGGDGLQLIANYHEVQAAPTPEDLLRGVRSSLHRNRGKRRPR